MWDFTMYYRRHKHLSRVLGVDIILLENNDKKIKPPKYRLAGGYTKEETDAMIGEILAGTLSHYNFIDIYYSSGKIIRIDNGKDKKYSVLGDMYFRGY